MSEDERTHLVIVGYALWIFGFLGAHRFYFGKPITGTLYLVTFSLLSGGFILTLAVGAALAPVLGLIAMALVGAIAIGLLLDLVLMPSLARDADDRYLAGVHDYTIAWVLLTFVGVFGIHRFYLGKWLSGALYLLTGAFGGLGLAYDFWTLNGQISDANAEAELAYGSGATD